MKNLYNKTKVWGMLLGLFSLKMSAQLSGVVTINNTLPASATNYTSFTALAADVNTAGINAPLTINVVAGTGPYNEQVTFTVIPGATAVNTITMNGNGCTISFSATSTSSVHTFMLSGTDYMKVNNLNIVSTNSTMGLPLHLWNGADNNSFNTCTITVPPNNTASGVVPVSVSGSSTSATTGGTPGLNLNDEFINCVINSGYYGIVIYGPTSGTFSNGHKIINCKILDSYYTSVYLYYTTDIIFRGNLIDRSGRATIYSGTSYGIKTSGNQPRDIFEKNIVRNIFGTVTSNSYYAFNINSSGTSGNEIIIRNNLISDIRTNGTVYGIYNGGYGYQNIVHNTISLDDATATGGGAYGIQVYTGPLTVKNNVISITKGGTGTKYCLYYSGTASQFTSNNNVLYLNAPAGTNYMGYVNANYNTLSALQAINFDVNSVNIDPMYAIPGTNYAPTNMAVNNLGVPVGVTDDINGATRSLSSPDPGAFEIFNANCFGNPGTSTITTPSFTYCAGTPVNIALAASVYTNSGISYQWVSSTTSALGPFNAIPGSTLTSMVTSSNVNVTTYYSTQVICANGGTTTVPAGTVFMVPTTTSMVPYYESFETLNAQNRLPNCSWAVSNSVTALTQTLSNPNGRIPRTGANFGMFVNSPTGANYFYTNGIQLDAGVTYSASLWWLTESVGYTNWTDLSILIGSNQSPTGQTTVATTNGPAVSPIHKLLTGNFTVPTSGIYYLAVRGTAASGSATYLSFDDIRVGIPCSLNSPSVTLNTLSSTVCSDKPMSILASGADTYTWNTGDNSAAITVTPGLSTTGYTLWATKLLSGCTSSFVQNITVNPSPILFAAASDKEVCAGQPVSLSALGQNVTAYSWSHGVTTPGSVVYPTTTTTYTVIGVNNYGCSSMATKEVIVNPLPNVAVNGPSQICAGDQVTLAGSIAGGSAGTYSWVSNTSIMYTGNPLVLSPQSSAVFTVTAMDSKGCVGEKLFTLGVAKCTGIATSSADANGVKIYPNPSTGVFNLELASTGNKTIEVADVTGRVILSSTTSAEISELNISALADGVYYVKVKSDNSLEVIKIVKSN